MTAGSFPPQWLRTAAVTAPSSFRRPTTSANSGS